MATALITAPASMPVTLTEVKQHLRIETDDDDVYITDLIKASVDHLEAVSGLKLITQTWREYFDQLPADGIFTLGLAPVQAVAEMRTYSAEGAVNSVSLTNIELDGVSTPPKILVRNMVPPQKTFNGIEIDLVAGFGDTSVDVPDSLRRALLLLVAHNYEFRGAVTIDQQPASEPHGFQTLLAPYRRVRI